MSLQELVELLKLNDSKVISVEELSTEKVTYWCCLVSYLMEIDPTDTEFEDVIPPVVNIITCIEKYVPKHIFQYFVFLFMTVKFLHI